MHLMGLVDVLLEHRNSARVSPSSVVSAHGTSFVPHALISRLHWPVSGMVRLYVTSRIKRPMR